LSITKSQAGLGNVDNTSDANKPVSTAQQTALNGKLAIASNLSDLNSAATARTNLGLGQQAVIPTMAKAGDVISLAANGTAAGPTATTLLTEYAMPIAFPFSWTVATVGIHLSTGSGTIRMGIRKDDGSARPSIVSGALLGQGSTTATAAAKDIALTVASGQSLTLAAYTLYWLIFRADTGAAATPRVSSVAAASGSVYYFGSYFLNAAGTTSSGSVVPGYTAGNTYATGALTDTGVTSWSAMQLSLASGANVNESFAGYVKR
jgi:hypothetical protein